MRWCSDFSRRPRTTPLKQSKRITSYGFSVGASGNDDEDRLEASGIGFQPSIHTHTQGPSHEPLTVASQRAAHDAIVARHYAPQFAQVIDFQGGKQTIVICPSGTAAGSPNYTYVYASYIDEPEMGSGSGGLRYYHRNQQYSIIAVTDGGGSVVERYACNAYGNVTIADASGSVVSNSAISNRYTFKGREWDQGLSLYHYRARMYDAVAGRIASWDPIGQSDGPNVYQYVSARPASYADPTGRMRTVPVPNWWKPFLPKDHQNHLQVPYDVWREIDDCFEDFWDWMDALNESYTDGKQICENDYEECICKRIVSELYENCEQLRIDCLGDEWKSYIEDVQSNIEDLQKCTSDALNPLEERARKGCQEQNQLFRENGS